jgi:ABC-type uncharacterized transport system ATPase subunit
VILREGEAVYDGSLAQVVRTYADHKVVRVHLRKEGPRPPPLEVVPYGEVASSDDVTLSLRVPRARVPEAAAALLARYPVADLTIEEADIGTIIERIQRARRAGTA